MGCLKEFGLQAEGFRRLIIPPEGGTPNFSSDCSSANFYLFNE